jgi:hypothetical protein
MIIKEQGIRTSAINTRQGFSRGSLTQFHSRILYSACTSSLVEPQLEHELDVEVVRRSQEQVINSAVDGYFVKT